MKIFRKYSTFDLIWMALIAVCGIAVKPVVVSVAHLLTGPLFIPGGALAGGFYMLFVVLGAAVVGKMGSATIICVVQTLLVLVTGVYGSHGAASILTYILPGVLVDLLWLISKNYGTTLMSCFLGTVVANCCGTLLVNWVFFRLPALPLLLSLLLAIFSGGLGGVIAWQLLQMIGKHGVLPPPLEANLTQPTDQVKQEDESVQ